VSLVQEWQEVQSQGKSLRATWEGKRAGGVPGHGCLQQGFPCLTQPLPQPCVIPMQVAQSGVFTMGNITRECLYLEHHSNKSAHAEGDGSHAQSRTRLLRGTEMTPESSAL
jgi:hypothetical protein